MGCDLCFVSNTLLELRHKLRQFWRRNGIQPGASKVHLEKYAHIFN